MKQLLSLVGMGVLCLLLSTDQVQAQVSRKGDPDGPKVILKKKDKEETADKRSEPAETSTTRRDRETVPSRTERSGRTYPDRRDIPTTREGRRFPDGEVKRDPRMERPRPSVEQTQRGRKHRGGNSKHSGRDLRGAKAHQHDHDCNHPGRGRHLGWHKQKGKKFQ